MRKLGRTDPPNNRLVYQTQPRQVQIKATIHPPRAGVTIYLDLEDPPDTSPYGTPAPNDNLGGPACLPPACSSTASAIKGSDGTTATILTITDRYAGDNYRVRARLTTGDPLIAKTGIITAWKRIFVESDKMLRQRGQALALDAAAGATSVMVLNTLRFLPGDSVLIFDTVNQVPETNTVQATLDTEIQLTDPLASDHLVTNFAYIGRAADGFFEPDLCTLTKAFDDPFVQLMVLPDGSGVLPYTPKEQLSSQAQLDDFSQRWFKNGQIALDNTNYVHVIGCEKLIDPVSGLDIDLGLTLRSQNWTYVCRGRVEELYPPPMDPLVPIVLEDVVAHEMGHQFGLPAESHLGHPAWCNPAYCGTALCLMEDDENLTDGTDEFEVLDLISGAAAIRRVADPI